MKRNETEKIKEAVSVLVGTPLREFSRIASTLYFRFGDIVEVNGSVLRDDSGRVMRDGEGNVLHKKHLNGMYALDILCAMRFICGNDIILAKSDIFLPIDEIYNKEDFIWDNFDWHTHGNNRFDELLAKHFCGEYDDYIVKSVKVGKFGDLTILFENDFILEFFLDSSGESENWRFGETNSTWSLIVTSNGIATE